VARSFFSRLVRGGGSAPLAPPRPVSNLWKRAQIDAAAAGPSTEALSASGRSTIQPSYTADSAQPLNPAEVESRPAPQLSSTKSARSTPRARARQTSVSGEVLRPTPAAAASAKTETTPEDPPKGQPGRAFQALEPTAPGLESPLAGFRSGEAKIIRRGFPSAISSAPSVPSRRGPQAQPPSPSPAARPVEAKPDPLVTHPVEAKPIRMEGRLPNPVEPNPPVERPVPAAADRQPMLVSGRALQDEAAPATRPFPTPPPIADAPGRAPPPQARLQPLGLAAPLRAHEASLTTRQGSAPEEPRAKENTVQIGKIEVQVVPPPAPSYRLAPPAPPKARLARGYALWPGW
jgi:hypothetical protein